MNNKRGAWISQKPFVVEEFQGRRPHSDHSIRFVPIYGRACRPMREALGSNTFVFTLNIRRHGVLLLRTLFREKNFDAVW